MEFKLGVLAVSILLLLAACSEEKEAAVAGETVHPPIENRKDLEETLPVLKLTIEGMEFPTARGGYSWSYFDEKEKRVATIEAESLSPLELAENQEAPAVNETAAVDLHFEKEPDAYNVQIWNVDGVGKGPFNDIVLDESSGKTVYQVISHWEQGTVTYVFSLTVE